jgi:hypothetical protein
VVGLWASADPGEAQADGSGKGKAAGDGHGVISSWFSWYPGSLVFSAVPARGLRGGWLSPSRRLPSGPG